VETNTKGGPDYMILEPRNWEALNFGRDCIFKGGGNLGGVYDILIYWLVGMRERKERDSEWDGGRGGRLKMNEWIFLSTFLFVRQGGIFG
jgi:hypothetical protein